MAGETVGVCDGIWYANELKCVGVSCGPAPEVSHASVNTTGDAPLETATYTCDPGYYLNSSSSVLTCLSNGTWSLEVVTCAQLMCDAAMLPAFTEVFVGTGSATTIKPSSFVPSDRLGTSEIQDSLETSWPSTIQSTVYEQGEEVKIRCIEGYLMFTTSINQAQMLFTMFKCFEGTWTSVFNLDVICLPEYCTGLPFVSNADIELWNQPDAGAKYRCSTGYVFETITMQGLLEVVPEISIYCYEGLGWEDSPAIQVGCIPVVCGSIGLPVGSGLQVPPDHPASFGSKVTLACVPPLYQNTTDAEAQKVVECLADGSWSLGDVTLTCAPCDQSWDAAGIPHSVLEVNSYNDAIVIGDTGELSCVSGFMLPGISRTVQCGSVDGTPTWLDLENATCLQTRFVESVDFINKKGTSVENYITVPVHLELMNTGLEGCAELKRIVAHRIWVSLEEVQRKNKRNLYPARASFLNDDKTTITKMTIEYSLPDEKVIIPQKMSLLEEDYIFVDNITTLCLKLNVTDSTFQVSKDGKMLMEEYAVRYKDITYFATGINLEVFEINITYF
ncbi:hypothetical protein EGW08_001559 [Elysia chlorotica]|uniref:Sushi domain-containing protein n=1 Tax=Elysia chlorotica TaxID=188477 RepID=A0A3S1CER2_ELYCH|nr:hypothetical protein EGW08_001559 [Elysia chlorotica]